MSERVLIVGDGGLTTAVACAVVADGLLANAEAPTTTVAKGSAGMLWLPAAISHPNQLAARRNGMDLLAGTYGFELNTSEASVGEDLSSQIQGSAREGLGTAAIGLLASLLAFRSRCTRVVWSIDNPPGPAGPEDVSLTAATRTIDRCVLLERLALNEIGSDLRIEAPYADLSDNQLAEIALELGVPLKACWWWGSENDSAPRWHIALEQAGWPEHLLPALKNKHRLSAAVR